MNSRLVSHLEALVGERHPVSSPKQLARTESYLTEQFHQLGWHVSHHSFPAFGGTYRNVIARHPSSVSPRASGPSPLAHSVPLLIGAHYDTVPDSPGADDNASGVAVLLEVARRLRDARLERPVELIAFCLEEDGLIGSLAYAARLKEEGRRISGALVLECVGYASTAAGSQRTPAGVPIDVPTVGDFLGVIGNEASSALVKSFERVANRDVAALKTVSLIVPGQGEMLPDTRRSDHTAFWEYGFPALMLTDTADYRNPHYHQPTDTIETLDLEFLEKVADALAAAAVGVGPTS